MSKIPDTPGVYFFLGPKREVLYIGKATSLRDRTRSYFVSDIAGVRSQLIAQMVAKSARLDWRQTDSVLEALLLEASLVRTNKPKYNTDLKDDKSYNYVVITKEAFPRVMTVRGKELESRQATEHFSFSAAGLRGDAAKLKCSAAHTFGPFPHGMQLQEALRIIRKIFPYRDSRCTPASEQLLAGKKPKACFNRHIGLCPGVCTGDISHTEYRKTIRRIVLLFQGKKQTLLKSLERDMKLAAKKEDFEEAVRLRRQLFALNHIQDVSLIKDEYRTPGGHDRIEAYDVAHLAGSAAVGVMVVVEGAAAQHAEYRTFTIKTAKAGDDPGALKEILSRRLGHNEWPLPRLIVVDGATAQIRAAQSVLQEFGVGIPVVGVVKDEKHRPREIRGDKTLVASREKDILLANAEAHRFAIGRHRKLYRREMGI